MSGTGETEVWAAAVGGALGGGILTLAGQWAGNLITRPVLKLRVLTEPRFQVLTPIKKRLQLHDGTIISGDIENLRIDGITDDERKKIEEDLKVEGEATFLRAEIVNEGRRTALGCLAFLTAIRFVGNDGVQISSESFGDMVPLNFSFRPDGRPTDILPKVRYYVDIVSSNSMNLQNKFLIPSPNLPLRYARALGGPGKYDVDLMVVSSNGESARESATFVWDGQWRSLKWVTK